MKNVFIPSFNYYYYIITATALITLATLTPDYEVLTNQGDAPVSVYINSVAL